MKVAETKTDSTANKSVRKKQEPFFNKEGQSSFFSKYSEPPVPFFGPATIQPKSASPSGSLTIGQPNDKYEREADAMAYRVMHMPMKLACSKPLSSGGLSIQAKCTACNHEEEKIQLKPLMMKSEGGTPVATQALAAQLNNTKGSGGPLPSGTNNFMGQAFGVNFSHVRVHYGNSAIQMNQALNARAFTHGSDIYFNKGEYSPFSSAGKKLLGHELTHVVQQGKSQNKIQRQTRGGVQPTNTQQSREFVNTAITYLNDRADFYRHVRGLTETRFQGILDGLKGTIDNNLQVIDNSLRGNPSLKQRLRQAYRSAVQAIVTVATQQLRQTNHGIYQSNRSRIHESAWPQGVQDAAAHTSSAGLPGATRQRLRVLTADTSGLNLLSMFSANAGSSNFGSTTVIFSGAIPQSLRRGLQNVAKQLIPNTMALNSTITLGLDLGRYGGSYDAYRYTYSERTTGRGRSRTRVREIRIERLGAIGMEGVPDSQRTANQQKFQQFGFIKRGRWRASESESLLAAIGQLPDSVLTLVRGLTFRRASASATDPTAGGDYEIDFHRVNLYNRLMIASPTRFGTPGTSQGVTNNVTRAIVHEIGHAVDLRPLRTSWDALQATSGQPASQTNRARRGLQNARASSGTRYAIRSNVWNMTNLTQRGRSNSAFIRAARRDGANFPTDYPSPSDWWQEFYAETFSLYFTNPLVLEQTRPAIYNYFLDTFPR